MDLNTWLDQFKFLQGEWGWISQVFLVVLLAMVANFLLKRLLKRMRARLEQTRNLWDDALVRALERPLPWLVWVVGLAAAAQIVYLKTHSALFAFVEPVRDVAVIVLLAWFLIRFINEAEQNILTQRQREGRSVDRTTVDAVGKLLRVTVIITTTLVILQTLGYSISGVLAFGGIGGIAVGFAAKDLLANFFGGLMIYLDRPFAVGDWIYSPDREIEGTVEKIGWRLTTIRTFDKRPLYVPNATFTSIAVVNPSRMTHRRIYETIGIRYDDLDKMAAICADVEAMLRAHPDIDTTQTLMVHFNAFSESSVDFFVYTFTKTTVWTEYHRIKQDVLLKIHAIIAEHGAQEAFPTRTVHLPEGVRVVPPELAGHPQVEGGAPSRRG